jgi:MFS family permease
MCQLYGTFGVMYGLTGGSLVVIGPLLWAAHFGRRHQGTIRGVMSPFYLIASIGGPLFAAFVYDQVGSLEAAFRVFAATLRPARYSSGSPGARGTWARRLVPYRLGAVSMKRCGPCLDFRAIGDPLAG